MTYATVMHTTIRSARPRGTPSNCATNATATAMMPTCSPETDSMCDRPAAANRVRSVGESSCMSAIRSARTNGASPPKWASIPLPIAARQRANALGPLSSRTVARVTSTLPRDSVASPATAMRAPATARPFSTAILTSTPQSCRATTKAPGLASVTKVASQPRAPRSRSRHVDVVTRTAVAVAHPAANSAASPTRTRVAFAALHTSNSAAAAVHTTAPPMPDRSPEA